MIKTTQNSKRAIAGKSSATKTGPNTVSAAAFEKFLKGTNFPVNKKGLIDHLRKNKATQQILHIANRFNERDYSNVVDVAKEFSRVKDG